VITRTTGHELTRAQRHEPHKFSGSREQQPKEKPKDSRKFGSPSQTKNKVAVPATTLPTNTPTPITAVIMAELLSPPPDPLPLGAGVGSGGEEPPPDPPPCTKKGFTDSWRDVVIVKPFSSTWPTQLAMPELIAHERLISSWGREAITTASEGPWTIVAVRGSESWNQPLFLR
jgi:hypothetical protein